jgi:Domain of unknown function (DUF4345)
MNSERLTPVVLALCGFAMLYVGWSGLTAPATLMDPLGIRLQGAAAHSEIRAAYGGMHVGIGLFLIATALRAELRALGLWANLCIMGGLVAGRLASLVVDGAPGGFALGLLATEGIAALASVALVVARTYER